MRESRRDAYLQNPLDRFVRKARPHIADPVLGDLLDRWLAAIDENYKSLAAGAQTDHGEVTVDALMLAGPGVPNELYSPARARTAGGEINVATSMLRVERGVSPQPDGIPAQAGETWRIHGHVLEDGVIMPCRGTFRLAR